MKNIKTKVRNREMKETFTPIASCDISGGGYSKRQLVASYNSQGAVVLATKLVVANPDGGFKDFFEKGAIIVNKEFLNSDFVEFIADIEKYIK